MLPNSSRFPKKKAQMQKTGDAVSSRVHNLSDDAMDLALLIYDIYKAEKANGKIINGQINANDTKIE